MTTDLLNEPDIARGSVAITVLGGGNVNIHANVITGFDTGIIAEATNGLNADKNHILDCGIAMILKDCVASRVTDTFITETCNKYSQEHLKWGSITITKKAMQHIASLKMTDTQVSTLSN